MLPARMRKLRLYLDTSVFSACYDERTPERQRLTQEFWMKLGDYEVLCLAVAVLGGADILVSWNFQHLVRRSTRLLANYVNASRGLPPLEILAPPEG